jgi:hypothetical protein
MASMYTQQQQQQFGARPSYGLGWLSCCRCLSPWLFFFSPNIPSRVATCVLAFAQNSGHACACSCVSCFSCLALLLSARRRALSLILLASLCRHDAPPNVLFRRRWLWPRPWCVYFFVCAVRVKSVEPVACVLARLRNVLPSHRSANIFGCHSTRVSFLRFFPIAQRRWTRLRRLAATAAGAVSVHSFGCCVVVQRCCVVAVLYYLLFNVAARVNACARLSVRLVLGVSGMLFLQSLSDHR